MLLRQLCSAFTMKLSTTSLPSHLPLASYYCFNIHYPVELRSTPVPFDIPPEGLLSPSPLLCHKGVSYRLILRKAPKSSGRRRKRCSQASPEYSPSSPYLLTMSGPLGEDFKRYTDCFTDCRYCVKKTSACFTRCMLLPDALSGTVCSALLH